MGVLGSPSLISLMVSVDVKHHDWLYLTVSRYGWPFLRFQPMNQSDLELRSCVKVEVAVLGSPSLISLMVSLDVKQHWTTLSALRSCVKVEVAVPGSPSLISLMVSVDATQDLTWTQSKARWGVILALLTDTKISAIDCVGTPHHYEDFSRSISHSRAVSSHQYSISIF